MNDFKKIILQGHEQRIYEDVIDPTDIITYLQSRNIITIAEKHILSGNQNLTEKLVKVLLKKDDGPWFDHFVEALNKEYNWISISMKSQFELEHARKMTYYLRGRGNVPPLPQHNITRHVDVQKLREEIRGLRRDWYLVVHGMSGFGKTCLVVDALHDVSLLENTLNGCVYWLSVGDLRDDEPDDLQCHQLQMKLCEMAKIQLSSAQKDLKVALKTHFTLEPNHSALLVLDKVRSWKVVDALNIGCKILVTTQDTDVVRNQSRKIRFAVSDGFSENESVSLLEDFVYDKQGTLQRGMRDIAVKIHRAWKGHPMVIGLIGGELSEFKEESQNNLSRWKEYDRTPILQDSSTERRRSVFEEQINSVIGLTIDKLSEEDKKLFNMLAVLVEDTNITTDVLEILWKKPNSVVQQVIDHFYRRSLVFKKYNSDLEKSVYGIHDIIMEYLKKSLSDLELKAMHQDLISKYFDACKGNFANLPQDNYIFSYLCHHIEKGEKWNRFRGQFFRLKYVESKLKATSPADLLLDLCKYFSGLVSGSNEQSVVEEMIKFVNDSGWDIHQGEVDVLQCALLQPRSSFIFQQAASEIPPSKIYFLPLSSSERPHDLETNVSNVSSLSIINNGSIPPAEGRILIYPDEEKSIVELDMNYRRKRRSFKEKSDVTLLKMSPLNDKFLSALVDGQIHIWNLNHSKSNADTPPPSLRQKSYLHNFFDVRTTPSSSFAHKRRVTCASFSCDGKRVVSSSDDGSVVVWNLEEDRNEHDLLVFPNPIATSCCFLNNDTTIVYGCQNMTLVFYNLETGGSFSYALGQNNHGLILDLLCMSDEPRKLIIVQEWQVQLLMWEKEILRHRREGVRPMDFVAPKTKILHRNDSNIRINCSVYYHRHILLLGTNDGCLYLSDILSDSIKHSKFGSGEIKAVDMTGGRIVFAQSNSVKMCWPESGQRRERRPLSAHLGWISDSSVYATVSSTGNLQVFDNGLQDMEVDLHGCVVRVSTYGQHILIGTLDGKVLLYDIKTKTNIPLQMRFSSEILYLSIGVLYTGTPVYFASAKSSTGEVYTLQAGMYGDYESHCQVFRETVPVVKTFTCLKRPYVLTVLQNYSIMASEIVVKGKEMLNRTYSIQEGRQSAKITDGFLSPREDILVLSDEETCFHVISLDWSQYESPYTNIARVGGRNCNLRLSLPPLMCEPQPTFQTTEESVDEVDGIRSARPEECPLRVTLSSYPLTSSSRCTCICPKGLLAAIGYDDLKISVWDLQRNVEILNFVVSERKSKLAQMKFSPYSPIQLGGGCFELVLCVITDCLSLWDLSPYINSKSNHGKKLQCIGLVTGSGNPLLELSINQAFTRFSAYDEEGSFFLWKVFVPNDSNADNLDVNKNKNDIFVRC